MYLAYTGLGLSVLVYALVGLAMMATGGATKIFGRRHRK